MPSLGIRPYHKGVLHLGRSGYTWLQPAGAWGWCNAGLITNGDRVHESTRMMAAPIKRVSDMGKLREFFLYCFGAFHVEEVTQAPPARTFEGTLDSSVDDRRVHLKQAGPAHKHGDTIMSFGLVAKLNRSRR